MTSSDNERRNFIKKIFAGSVLCFIAPVNLFTKTLSEASHSSVINHIQTLDIKTLKRNAKDAFYRRNYPEARLAYRSLIDLCPADISCYDGLRKTLGAEQNSLGIVELCEEGLSRNPDLPVFSERLARAYVSLATGNQRHEEIYQNKSGKHNLFESAVVLYLAAINERPDYKYLYWGLADALADLEVKNRVLLRYKEAPIELSDGIRKDAYLATEKFKSEWEQTRKPGKGVVKQERNIEELDFTVFVKGLSEKERRVLYFEEERQNRESNITKMKRRYGDLKALSEIRNKNYQQLLLLVMFILTEKGFSTSFIGSLRKCLCNKDQIAGLQLFYEAFYTKKKDVWTLLGRASSYKQTHLQIRRALDFYLQAENEIGIYSAKKIAAIYEGQAGCYFRQEEYLKGQQSLQKGLELLGDNGNSLSLIIKYAEGYAMQGNYPAAVNLLLYFVGKPSDFEKSGDVCLKYINPLPARGMGNNTFGPSSEDYLKVFYALCKLQLQNNDLDNLNTTLNWIGDYNPGDRFAQKIVHKIS